MARTGRPEKEIDWDTADKAAALMCTGEEIAALCKVNYDTLLKQIKRQGYANFSEWFQERAADTKKSLRRKQLANALGGNATMQIWLGKQYLNQAEKHENTNKISVDGISFSDDDDDESE